MSSITSYTSNLGAVTGITFDNLNNMYTVAVDNNKICKIDTEGVQTYLTLYDDKNIQCNQNVTFCKNDNCLYVMTHAMYFDKFDLQTNETVRFASNKNNSNQYGFCLDESLNLYFSGNNPHKIFKIDTHNNNESSNITAFIDVESNNINPYGITFDKFSNFYICNYKSNSYIVQYNSSGKLLNPSFITSSDGYIFANLVFDKDNNCYVSCVNTKKSNSKIVQYDRNGEFVSVIYSVDNTGLFGLSFDNFGNLYIANQLTQDVMKCVFNTSIEDTTTTTQPEDATTTTQPEDTTIVAPIEDTTTVTPTEDTTTTTTKTTKTIKTSKATTTTTTIITKTVTTETIYNA